MVQKSKAIVRIAGREYTIRASESEEYIHRVAIYVNRKMEEVIKAQPSLSMAMLGTLTAINLGDEVLKLQEELETLKLRVEELEEASKKTVILPSASDSSPAIYDVSRKSNRK
ncbi:MAG: cell division protein ZapA [Clostridia bacterium]|nr:cell division protein ZapA [Clostridia bacterium]MDD4681148.1 cell division protein ZapA [Clostridia bacterium]